MCTTADSPTQKGDGVATFPTKRATVCSTHGPIMMENHDVEVIGGSEEDAKGADREATSNHSILTHRSSRRRQQRPVAQPVLYYPSDFFSKHEGHGSETNSSNDWSILPSFPYISRRMLDNQEALIVESIVGEVRADINLDRIIEAAGCNLS